jgi:hypothetical protein
MMSRSHACVWLTRENFVWQNGYADGPEWGECDRFWRHDDRQNPQGSPDFRAAVC